MSCSCGCSSKSLLTLAKQVDPTRTKTLRDRFVADMTRRFRVITRLITESVVTNDAFGLNQQNQPFTLEAAGPGQFDFPQNQDKLTAFMAWLQQQERENIFEIVPSERIGAAAAGSWMNFYIDSAYKQGIRRARQEMRKEGVDLPILGNQFQDEISVAFNAPVHADRVALLYARDFSELQGITAAMDQQISRVLSEGLINGWGTERIAQSLNDRVEKIGLTRARMLARTEVIRAHHLATIQEYRNAEIQGVRVQAEFTTAGDGRVCQICKDLARTTKGTIRIYTLDEIESLIPAHPN